MSRARPRWRASRLTTTAWRPDRRAGPPVGLAGDVPDRHHDIWPMTRELLSAEDARILALESGTVRGHTCKVFVIAGERSVEQVRALLGERLGAAPRLMQRLDPATGPPAWIDDPDFSLERHVIDHGALDDAGLRQMVGTVMATPLERDRPLWAMDVVSPLAGGRTALVWRIHHALADGMTSMRMARELLLEAAAEEQPAPRPGPLGGPPPHGVPSAFRTAAHMPLTLRQELGRRATPSPLARRVGPRREVAFVDAPLEELRRIGHAAPERATVNDVALSAVGAGLRAWLDQLGAAAEGLRVKVPVSLHQPGEPGTANRDSYMVVDLPLEQDDPLARLVAVARETRTCKRRHDAETLDAFFRDLSHLSRSLKRYADHWAMSPRVFTLNVSNVPGPRGPQSLLGAPLLELHSLAEIAHGHALRVAIVSASGRISFGLCADPDAIGGLELIAQGIGEEIHALGEAIGGTPVSPVQ
jgi:diacylglycerol O-acyltransferase / wax synthase